MNSFRRNIVLNVFALLDKDRQGELNLKDIEESYTASAHPDVLSRRKGKEIVLKEFLETFELHHILAVFLKLMS